MKIMFSPFLIRFDISVLSVEQRSLGIFGCVWIRILFVNCFFFEPDLMGVENCWSFLVGAFGFTPKLEWLCV